MSGFVRSLFSDRIGGSRFGNSADLYKFEKIKQAKRRVVAAYPGRPFIDLGIGEPDEAADPRAVSILYEQAMRPENRGYTDNGIEAFCEAAARYMARVFGVEGLDPGREINHGIGSKSILALLPHAFINPGDIILTTVPGYPVCANAAKALGGELYSLPLFRENAFLPDFSLVPPDVLNRAKMLYINYPNNPTGAVAHSDFYREVASFAAKNGIIVVSDEAYAALVHDGRKPLSFLETPGAKEVGVSIQSLSKAFNMTGWRLAFIAGNADIVRAFRGVKDMNDSGQFAPIQLAGAWCLGHPEITGRIAEKYSRRMELLSAMLISVGLAAEKSPGTFYLYVPVPAKKRDGSCFESAEDFSMYLLNEHSISTVPWDEAGPFVRMSVTWQAESGDEQLVAELGKRLESAHFRGGPKVCRTS